MDSYNNLHSFYMWALETNYPPLDTRLWCFGLARKAFLLTIFLRIKVYPSNRINLDSRNSLYFFYDWALEAYSPHWDIRF